LGPSYPKLTKARILPEPWLLFPAQTKNQLQESLKTLIYIFSNNLHYYDSKRGKEMYRQFSTLFQKIGPLRMPSPNDLAGQSHTVRVFAKNLLEMALSEAIYCNQPGIEMEILEWLLRSGSDPDTVVRASSYTSKEAANPTLLQSAIVHRSLIVTRLLIRLGADVNLRIDDLSLTPLSLAVKHPLPSAYIRDEMVVSLLTVRAEWDPKDLIKPLILAIECGLSSVVQLLQEHGADLEFRFESSSWMISHDTALSLATQATNPRHFQGYRKPVITPNE
jgi:hypothetical protein